jgi:hypothetical protein
MVVFAACGLYYLVYKLQNPTIVSRVQVPILTLPYLILRPYYLLVTYLSIIWISILVIDALSNSQG